MTVSHGGKAQLVQPSDSSALVLMQPLPPENTLPHVKDTTVLEAMALIQPKRVALDGNTYTGPVC